MDLECECVNEERGGGEGVSSPEVSLMSDTRTYIFCRFIHRIFTEYVQLLCVFSRFAGEALVYFFSSSTCEPSVSSSFSSSSFITPTPSTFLPS